MNFYRLSLVGLLAAGCAVSSVAYSQSFSGFYVDAGIGYGAMTSTVEVAEPSIGSTSLDIGKSNFLGSLAGGWTWNPGGGFVLGIGAFANLGGSDAAELTSTDSTGTYTIGLKQKESYGITIEPGFEVHPGTVVYAKLTAAQAKLEATVSETGFGSASQSETFTGYGFGAGVKHLINKNLFVFAEWQQIQYQSKSWTDVGATLTVKPTSTLGLIGVGWQF